MGDKGKKDKDKVRKQKKTKQDQEVKRKIEKQPKEPLDSKHMKRCTLFTHIVNIVVSLNGLTMAGLGIELFTFYKGDLNEDLCRKFIIRGQRRGLKACL